jgi:hypothetical protein
MKNKKIFVSRKKKEEKTQIRVQPLVAQTFPNFFLLLLLSI